MKRIIPLTIKENGTDEPIYINMDTIVSIQTRKYAKQTELTTLNNSKILVNESPSTIISLSEK